MPPLPIINAKTFIKFLESLGFVCVRQKGSHKRFKHPDGRAVTIPVHSGKNLKRGLLKGILNSIDVSVDELDDFLKGKK